MPQPRNKKFNSIRDVREKERLEKKREEQKKYNKKKAVEMATTKKPFPSYEEMLSKVKVPPKTAMDSVRTMPDRSMKKNTMKQMKKKDMLYGGKKPMGYGGKKMRFGGMKKGKKS